MYIKFDIKMAAIINDVRNVFFCYFKLFVLVFNDKKWLQNEVNYRDYNSIFVI